jgi:copper homeostasis protein CutC
MLKARIPPPSVSLSSFGSDNRSTSVLSVENLSFVFVGVAAGLIMNACSKSLDYMCYNVPFLHPLLNLRKKSQININNQKNTFINHDRTVEVCVSDIESVLEAIEGGATSLELCSDRPQGGITPSLALIEESVKQASGSNITIHVLIRPRPGGFVYSNSEFDLMIRDILTAKMAGAHGVVVGVLTSSNHIDMAKMRVLRAVSEGMLLTFHRAYDVAVGDPLEDLQNLIHIGCDRLLTSGKSSSAMHETGSKLLTKLVANSLLISSCDDTPKPLQSPIDSTHNSLVSEDTDMRVSLEQFPNIMNEDSPMKSSSNLFKKLFNWASSSSSDVTSEISQDDTTSMSVPKVSQSMRLQATANIADSRISAMTIVAAAGIAADSELSQFLRNTGIRAIHAGSSVTALRQEESYLGDFNMSNPSVYMGSDPSANDTTSFSCAVAAKVHQLVSEANDTWDSLDQLALEFETGRLLTECVIASDHAFSTAVEGRAHVDAILPCSRPTSAQGSSDDEYFAESRVV